MKPITSLASIITLFFSLMALAVDPSHNSGVVNAQFKLNGVLDIVSKGERIADNLSKGISDLTTALNQTTPYLIKVSSLNLIGIICACSGLYIATKGIHQSCSPDKQPSNEQTEKKSFFKRYSNIIFNPSLKGIYQSSAGIATFIAGLMTIAKSEYILLKFA